MKTPAVVLLALSIVGTAHAAAPKPPMGPDGRAAFERLKALVGTWHGHFGKDESPAEVTYHLIGGGNIVMESLFPGTPKEMVSMYFLDGGNLIMTHYCSVGNQPQMVYDRKGS